MITDHDSNPQFNHIRRHGDHIKRTAGVLATDDPLSTDRKVTEYKDKELVNILTEVALEEANYFRSEQSIAIQNAKNKNFLRLIYIALAAGLLAFTLHTLFGKRLLYNHVHKIENQYNFTPSELLPSQYGSEPNPTSQKYAIDRFSRDYGELFQPRTPFSAMFENCKNQFSCTDISLPAVLQIKRHAVNPTTLLDDICTLNLKINLESSFPSYSGPIGVRYTPKGQTDASCQTTNPDEVKAAFGPIKNFSHAIFVLIVFVPSILLFWILSTIISKTPIPKLIE